jgi:protein-tyrosine phosphatase
MSRRCKSFIPKFNLGISQNDRMQDEDPIFSPKTPFTPYFTNYKNFRAAQILKGTLFLGSENDAREAPQDIKRFLCVADNCEVVERSNATTMHIPIKDHSDQAIIPFFSNAFHFINEGIEKNEPVLVYCQKGYSRSVTFVIGYMMTFYQKMLQDFAIDGSESESSIFKSAFGYVKSKRRKASPNLGFCIALDSFGKNLG